MHVNVAVIVVDSLKNFMEGEMKKVVYQQHCRPTFVLSNEALSC